MQTIFEIFDPVTGDTEGYKTREGADRYIARMEAAGFVRDWLPAKDEGFYVVDMRGSVKFGVAFIKANADRYADFENMGSDTNSYTVVEHTL